MKYRKNVNRRSSKRKFTRTAMKVHPKNVRSMVMRGGLRA